MDEVIITAAVVLAVVAIIEILTIFFSLPSDNTPLYVMVLPVFGTDENFAERLDILAQKGCGRRNIILIDYSADDAQKELCRRFVKNDPDAVFIHKDSVEKYMKMIFLCSKKG